MAPTMSPPPIGPIVTAFPKPLIGRRPTLVRKREEDSDDEIIPSSPGKKAKVSFDDDVDFRTIGEAAPHLIQEEVRLAFDKRAWSQDEDYDKIKEIFTTKKDAHDEVSSTTLRNYTAALLNNVSRLGRPSSDLVHVIINSQWLGRQDDYVALFAKLLGALVVQHGVHLEETMRMLVENLTSAPPSSGRIQGLPRVSRSTIFARVHKTLKHLVRLVPSASRELRSMLMEAFPHETDSNRTHKIYIHNLLKLIEYVPELRLDVLALATERLVKLDVGVQVDIEDLADDAGDDLVQKIGQVQQSLEDDENSDMSDTESEDDEEDEDDEVQRTKDIMKNVEKMDSMLEVLFEYYDKNFSRGSAEDQIGTVDILLSQFATTILPALRSRHTQFLLFHFAQQSPAYIDTFVGTCIQITFDKKKQPAIKRQASAAYLASFVARGLHVPANIVRDVFAYIGSELEQLRREYEPNCRGPNLGRYSDFYSLVQALLYVFCFRWRDLQVNDEDDDDDDLSMQEHQWRSGVKEALSQNIFSKLNPLKVCSPAIVTEFARVANHLNAVYVFHLLETNKRVRLSQFSNSTTTSYKHNEPERETALTMSADESHQHLDEYFPFDPYHLPKSKHWIEGDYREWAGVPGLDDEQEEESDDEGDAMESDVEEGTGTDESGKSM